MKISIKTRISIVVVILFWGSAFVGIRAGLQGYSPGGLALLRFLIASLTLLIIYCVRGNYKPIQRQDLLSIFMIGFIGIGCYNISLNYGELSVPSGMSCFIVSQSPIITALIAIFFLKERITLFNILGMLISMIGVAMICINGANELKFYLSIFFVLIATVISGLYSVFQKKLLQKYNALDLTAYVIWSGTLSLLIFTPNLINDLNHTTIKATIAVIYLGICPGALAYLIWSYILNEIPASRAVTFLYVSPLMATFIGWLWLAEVPHFFAFMGGLIALLGVWLVNQSYHRPLPLLINNKMRENI